MTDVYNFKSIFIKPIAWYLLIISRPNLFAVLGSYYPVASSYLNNN